MQDYNNLFKNFKNVTYAVKPNTPKQQLAIQISSLLSFIWV